MAGTTRTILDNWSATAVKTAINTARSAVSLSAFSAWQSELPIFPAADSSWEEWLRGVPTPFGLVMLGDTTEEEYLHTGKRAMRRVTVYVIVSVTAANTLARHQVMADTEDSTVKGVEAALWSSYFADHQNYPIALYEGCEYLPFETVRADLETGVVICRFIVQAVRTQGVA